MFEWLTSGVAFLNNLRGLHSWFSGLKTGSELQSTLQKLHEIDAKIERLGDGILHANNLRQVHPIVPTQTSVIPRKQLAAALAPIHDTVRQDILAGAIYETSNALARSDPWK